MSNWCDLQLMCSTSCGSNAKQNTFKKVSCDENQATFSCPLSGSAFSRKEFKIYFEKAWPDNLESADVYVNNSKSKKEKLCSLSASETSFEWIKSKSSRDQTKLLCSDKVFLECELIVAKDNKISPLTEIIVPDPSTPKNLKQAKLIDSPNFREMNENTPVIEAEFDNVPITPKLSKKRPRDGKSDAITPKSRRQRVAMRALSTNAAPTLSKLKTKAQMGHVINPSGKTSEEEPLTDVLPSSRGNITRCVDLSTRVPKPTSRWGHTMCLINSEQAVLIGGQGEKTLSKDSIWYLHPEMRTWKCPEVSTESIRPECRIGHSATFDPTMRCIYVYGGSKNTKWFHDVHMYDMDEQKWSLVKAEGKAPTRAYHSATLHRHELWVFGGVFPRPDPQPDGCDNEVHIFSPVMQSWYSPIVMGDKPRARSGHSANLINDMLVVFGGWDFPYCYDDLFVLDLTIVEWTQPKCLGKPPKPRSWHASCTLTDNRIFIHGGYDGDNALHDAHIFDYYSKTWQELVLENAPSPRAGHSCLRLHSEYENETEDEVIIFGGGDNDGSYFSDMFSFYVPHEPKLVTDTD